jgi:Tfp pilus assembly PilM family ATPase
MIVFQRLAGTRTPIGLDLGSSGVRAVQLTQAGDRYRVASVSRFDIRSAGADHLPPPVEKEREGDAEHRRQQIAAIISCLQRSKFHGRLAVTALNAPDVQFHTLELPPAALHDTPASPQRKGGRHESGSAGQIVRWEIERLMTGDSGSVETRHWALPPASVPAPNAIGLGASRALIERTVTTCARAGLRCSRIDTTATALSRLGRLLHPFPPDQVWGVLDIGERESRLVLCLDDIPVLVRSAGAGGRAWTQRIADALHLSLKAAEVHKRHQGIAHVRQRRLTPMERDGGEPGEMGSRDELPSMLLGALRGELNELAAEIKRSYEYVLSCYAGRKAADLILVGGGAALRNLPEFLAGALGIPVTPASTYLAHESCRLEYADDHRDPLDVLAVAVGLVV